MCPRDCSWSQKRKLFDRKALSHSLSGWSGAVEKPPKDPLDSFLGVCYILARLTRGTTCLS